MAKGKFSSPRPYREEEREIEESFRQVTDRQSRRNKGNAYVPALRETSTMPKLELELDRELTSEELLHSDLTAPWPGEEPAPQEADQPLSVELPRQEPLPEEQPQREEQQPQEQPDFLDRLMAFVEENRKMVLVGTCGVALVLILAFIGLFFLGSAGDPYKGKILNNVMVAGINVGGLTKAEAIQVVEQNVGDLYEQQPMTIRLGGTTMTLVSADTGAQLDVKAAVAEAYSYGRTGTKEEREAAYAASFTGNHTIGLLPYLNLNQDYIRQVLESYGDTVGSVLTQPSYKLEGQVPDLATDVFDPETAQPLTLVITMGTPGVNFQAEALLQEILDAYSLARFQISWDDTDPDAEPEKPDLAKIRQELCLAPVDDSLDRKTYETIPGSYGYDFDTEQAQQLVDQAQYGQILRVEMTYVAPEHMGEEILFRDVLAEAKTPYSDNANRVNNLQLACQAINGLVLNPGETFSFNDTLGERTAQKGYLKAPAYSGTGLVNATGGGICQVSSTLYLATLLYDLETVERHDHGFTVAYMDLGMDATVSWNGPDFKFRNNANFPIKIQAEASDHYVTVQILGTDEKDYYIEMSYVVSETYRYETEYQQVPEDNPEGYKDGDVIQDGVTGYLVRTYKNKYSKTTGELISKDYVTYSRYITVNKIVAKVVAEETVPPETEETAPEESTAPSAPSDPSDPTTPSAPSDPSDPTTPSTPSEPSGPAPSSKPTDPPEPSDPAPSEGEE